MLTCRSMYINGDLILNISNNDVYILSPQLRLCVQILPLTVPNNAGSELMDRNTVSVTLASN